MTGDYYQDRLSAENLKRCYEIAPRRVQQYLQAEIDYISKRIRPGSVVLELGCGYGRVMRALSGQVKLLVGIDTSRSSLQLCKEQLADRGNCLAMQMNALHTAFCDQTFDLVVCIQNGISALQVDQQELVCEAIRITKHDGCILFSSYAERFWEERLRWFRLQAEAGLLGEIDETRTGNGVIVCKDGFRATTVSETRFSELAHVCAVKPLIEEVDGSSLFCCLGV
ncbi:class I SAM-dependent methyltransferase [bacterium]|nr:class I SAM-dependent methyltransferase [bacterium]